MSTAVTEKSPFAAPNAVFVMGPTASGKSEFAFRLAKRFGGEIVSADSMQIYRGMDIGTAKEPPSRREAVPHSLIDVVAPDEEYSVARFRDEATAAGRHGALLRELVLSAQLRQRDEGPGSEAGT